MVLCIKLDSLGGVIVVPIDLSMITVIEFVIKFTSVFITPIHHFLHPERQTGASFPCPEPSLTRMNHCKISTMTHS